MVDEVGFRVTRVIVRLKGIDLNQHDRGDCPMMGISIYIPNTVHLHVVSFCAVRRSSRESLCLLRPDQRNMSLA